MTTTSTGHATPLDTSRMLLPLDTAMPAIERDRFAVDPFRESVDLAGMLPPAANPFRPGPGRVPPAFGGRERPHAHQRVRDDHP